MSMTAVQNPFERGFGNVSINLREDRVPELAVITQTKDEAAFVVDRDKVLVIDGNNDIAQLNVLLPQSIKALVVFCGADALMPYFQVAEAILPDTIQDGNDRYMSGFRTYGVSRVWIDLIAETIGKDKMAGSTYSHAYHRPLFSSIRDQIGVSTADSVSFAVARLAKQRFIPFVTLQTVSRKVEEDDGQLKFIGRPDPAGLGEIYAKLRPMFLFDRL